MMHYSQSALNLRSTLARLGGVFVLLICCSLNSSLAQATSYEEGRKAYIDGEYKKALEILEPLAVGGDSESQKMLGIMYDYGHGVQANSDEALKWYLLSAEQGHPAVQYQVGAKYFRGDGVKQNYQEAAKWWQLASTGGQVDAQFNLGLMYFRGLSIDADDEKAAFLFSQAAEQDHGHAQYSLAVMYAFGRGLEKDYTTALEWFRKSADQNIGQAQFNLGVFYENGYGVDKNIPEAKNWYQLAAAQGVKEADKKLAQLDSMTDDTVVTTNDETEIINEELVSAVETATSLETDPDDMMEPVIDNTDLQSQVDDGEIKREPWALAQTPENYTLQIGSVTRADDIVNFIKQNNIENDAAYVQVVIKGVTRYNALYGVYDSYSAATEAVESLPASLRKVKPWVRSFRMIQKLLTQDSEN